jgi:hypothetical protein
LKDSIYSGFILILFAKLVGDVVPPILEKEKSKLKWGIYVFTNSFVVSIFRFFIWHHRLYFCLDEENGEKTLEIKNRQ